MTAITNPFTKVYDTLWTLLLGSAELSGMVLDGNRLKFNSDTDRYPLKEAISSEDMPELLIVSTGGPVNLQNSSSTTTFDLNYDIVMNTGDYRVNVFAHRLQWYCFCQLIKWQTAFATVTWKGEQFVKRLTVSNATIGQSLSERNRGIQGFTAIINVNVNVVIKTANIVPTE